MRKILKTLLFFTAAGIWVLSSCQAPLSTATPAQKAVITNQNSSQLEEACRIAEIGLVNDLTWSNDSQTLLAVFSSGASRYNAQTLEKLDGYIFEAPAALNSASPDGNTVAFSPDYLSINLVDIAKGKVVFNIPVPGQIGILDFSPDGETLLSTSMDEILVNLWDASSGELLDTLDRFDTAAPVYSAQFGEDGKHIVWISRGTVQVSPMDNPSAGTQVGHGDFVVSAALSPDGSLLATAAAGTIEGEFQPAIFVWSAANGELQKTITHSQAFNTLAFSPDGKLLAAASENNLLVYDANSGILLNTLEISAEDLTRIVFSPDGTGIAGAGDKGSIMIWQIIQAN